MRSTKSLWLAVLSMTALAVPACGDTVVSGGDGGTTSQGGDNATSGGAGGMDTTSGGAMGGDGGEGTGGLTAAECLMDHNVPLPADYDQYAPVMGTHCKGTNHQDIEGVEKLVFVGDSITQGTFPTPNAGFYRTVLADRLSAKFPGLEVEECAANGARMSDLQGQLDACFPDVEPKRTLVVMTMGGNDIAAWARDKIPAADAIADADVIATELRAAVDTLQDPVKFPAGSFFIFANVYEYTDGTGDLESCPLASAAGFSGSYVEGAIGIAHLGERMMEIAVETSTDMILLGEEFCGHGYRNEVMGSCYVGPDAEVWFDISCIHPTEPGHSVIADMFELVVDE